MSRKRYRQDPDCIFVHCKFDGPDFSWAQAIVGDGLFEYDNLDAFIGVLKRARKIVAWKASSWLRHLRYPLDNIIDVWNAIGGHSGFVPEPEQFLVYKDRAVPEFLFFLWHEYKLSGRLLYKPQNAARLPWETVRAWRGPIVCNKDILIIPPPAWISTPCDVASELETDL